MTRDYQVLVSSLRGVTGGVDVFSMHLVRGLRAQGIPARILLMAPDDPHAVLHEFPPDVPILKLPAGRWAGWRGRCRALVSLLESEAPCVYLPNYDYTHSCISPRLSKQVAVVGIVHSDDPAHYDHARRMGPYWNAVVAVTPEIAGTVARVAPELTARLTTIPYGVHVPPAPQLRPRGRREPLRVVYHGRLAQQQKRVLDLELVMAAAGAAGVDADLTVIGDGPDASELRRRCAPLVRGGTVRFLGPLPNDDALRVVEASDAFLLTSEFEGLPVSLLEAMARGCVPVVADTRSGIPQLVHDGVSGFRVAIGDIAGFVERLARLAGDAELRRRMGVAAHAAVDAAPYREESMLAGYRALFDGVIERAAAAVYQRPAGQVVPPPSLRWWHFLPGPIRSAGRRMRSVLRPAPRSATTVS